MKKFDSADLYFAVVFAVMLVTLFDVTAITVRILGLVAILAYMPIVLLFDWFETFAAEAHKRRHHIDAYTDWK